jgi:diguanylate cyclase (GGDEF)-like protein/PAS domain S-box-containing protein
MERRNAAPVWRASLGLVITVIAAGLLTLASWQAFWLGREAGSDTATLARERLAIQYQTKLYALLIDADRYRLQMELRQNPPFDASLRSTIDGEVRDATDFTLTKGESLEVLSDWQRLRQLWGKIRTHPRVYSGPDINDFARGLDDLIYRVEDTSGLQYESNRFAQDLADMLFAKMPGAVHEALYLDLLGENAQAQDFISIPNRVHVARLLSTLSVDRDLSADDWTSILRSLPGEHLATRAKAAEYMSHQAAYTNAGTTFSNYMNDNVLMRQTPAGEPTHTRDLAKRVVTAGVIMNSDLAALLDRQIALRINSGMLRNRYLYGIVLLGAVLLIGIMLIVAEFTANRDRAALQKAQQESERLSNELARQKAERALRLTEAQFRAVFDGAALGIAILDRNGAIVDANAVFRSIYGSGDSSAGVLEGHADEFDELMQGERDLFEFEQHVMTPSGQEAWTDSTVSLVNDDAGNPYFAIFMFRDLTELKRNERRILHDMTHDSLTGLPNRAQFESKMREQFSQSKNSPELPFAVLCVDLDRFKDINESLGHDAGDFVLSQVAQRLRAAIESADVVSRLGSDEFAVLVRSLPDVLHVEVIARRVLGALSKPVSLGERSIFVPASIGIALASGTYTRAEDVMRDAQIAMRYAKGGGGTRFAVFDSKMHARAQKRLELTTDLRLALENGEFSLLYQPIVKLEDSELCGCEALLRWNHPTEGIMTPTDFMALAEQTGLVVPIGRFVLRTACEQLAQWQRAGFQLSMNVNVSAAELLDPDFESVLMTAVNDFGVDATDLTLEITENVVLDAGTRPNALLERLRSYGFRICIDDFGTGYSSLRYLQQFKVDSIKVDRSFVSGHDGDVASEPIVRTLMTLAEAFDVRVVAEGVETQRQRDVLTNSGCRFGQGYYYARPLRADDLRAAYPSSFEAARKHASA